jgi:transposase
MRSSTGEAHWRILPTANVKVFSLAFSHFVKEARAGKDKRIVLVLDQARWHTAKEIEVPQGIHVEFLPSRSPELQPPRCCGRYPLRA